MRGHIAVERRPSEYLLLMALRRIIKMELLEWVLN